MKTGIPLIFFHLGDSYYLQYTFNQVLQSNPNSDIYLIGDDKNKHYESLGIKHINASCCEKTAKEFEKIYVHLSGMEGFVERVCFQRWMYIRDFIQTQTFINAFGYLDSDVLVYDDISKYYNKYCNQYDLAFNERCGPPCLFFKNLQILSMLVDNIFEHYSSKESVEALRNEYLITKKNITDMKMIELFSLEKDIKTYDLKQIVDGMTFDHSLTGKADQRFEMNGIFKKVYFKNKKAYCIETITGKEIQMLTLHIQGFYKMYMYKYYTGNQKNVSSINQARIRLHYQILKRKIYHLLKFLKLK